jgi:hypothetical protein
MVADRDRGRIRDRLDKGPLQLRLEWPHEVRDPPQEDGQRAEAVASERERKTDIAFLIAGGKAWLLMTRMRGPVS